MIWDYLVEAPNQPLFLRFDTAERADAMEAAIEGRGGHKCKGMPCTFKIPVAQYDDREKHIRVLARALVACGIVKL